MAKAELGTKRVCPETGRKFYDLDKDPIVSPYTGKEYPLSFFEETQVTPPVVEKESATKPDADADMDADDNDDIAIGDDGPEIISLDDAEDDDDDDDDDNEIPDIPDIPEVDIDDDGDDADDDTFLEDDDEDDDLSDVIVRGDDDKEDI